eukprot:gb/GECG01011158.1/.p1 GENE.gb/GECG01011158.1/~~gb/GECG01011158.1/.p1  ORF type:complete len:794 (+),score=102.15 gb/GECG01011158.1/:1-2382(+)
MAHAVEDLLQRPLQVVEAQFSQALQANNGQLPQEQDWGVGETFRKSIDDDVLERIPVVNRKNLQQGFLAPNTFVRYRGMVQDMFSPEYFQAVHQVTTPSGETKLFPTKYQDTFNPPSSSDMEGKQLQSRVPYYLVPIPGEASWARSSTIADNQFSAPVADSPDQAKASRKRPMEQEDEDLSGSTGGQGTKRLGANEEGLSSKRSGDTRASAADNSTQPQGDSEIEALKSYYPLPDETELPCLVRFYCDEVTGLKVGDMVEVVGVLSVDPQLTGEASMIGSAYPQPGDTAEDIDMRFAMANDGEALAKNPPASLVPRVQCVVWRHLASTFPTLQPPMSSSTGTFALSAGQENDQVTKRGSEAEKQRKQKEIQISVENEKTLASTAHSSLSELTQSTGCSISELRAQLVQYFSTCIGDDPLAAEYILFNILSRITSRAEGMALGKTSVNLSGAPDESSDTPETIARAQEEQRRVREWQDHQRRSQQNEGSQSQQGSEQQGSEQNPTQGQSSHQQRSPSGQSNSSVIPPAPADPTLPLVDGGSTAGKRLAQCISNIVPRSIILPMRLNNLNGLRFNPKKSYETNRLNAGVLQLPAGSHLLVDETVMHTGKLDETGVKNIQALANVMNTASLKYDFEYHMVDFPVDIAVLSLTAGRSLLPVDIRLPLSEAAQNNLKNAAIRLPEFSEQQLTALRKYFATVRNIATNMSQDVTKQVEQDMVEARQQSGETISQEYMHCWLSLAKLNAISHGEETLSLERWKQTTQLERERQARLPQETERAPVQPATVPSSPAGVRDA